MERRDNRRVLKLGERFNTNENGELQIIGFADNSKYRVRFFATGYETEVRGCKIKKGKVKDRLLPRVYNYGCIGQGKFNAKNEPVLYSRWKHMLARCYSGQYPDYFDCSVCERWLNFQNFVSDAKNLPGYTENLSGLALDKDGVVKGNRIYSPSTCQFISKEENTRLISLLRNS